MMNIVPISDLKNYTEVLSHCDDGSTVYLTKNGRGKYVVQSLAAHEKLQATVKLLAELSKGVESIRAEGVLSIDEAFAGLDEVEQSPTNEGDSLESSSVASARSCTGEWPKEV